MPPPPSPASSTCSDTTLPSTSQKRAKKGPAVREGYEKKDEEEWNLKDVVFVEDSKNFPMGRILKIDGSYAVVKFNQSPTTSAPAAPPVTTTPVAKDVKDKEPKEEDVASVLQDCRLLRLDDLQAVKNGTFPKSPDCIQKTPRRVHISDVNNILSLSVDSVGIHAIVRDPKKVYYKTYNLSSGKAESESAFPSETGAVLGADPGNIFLECNADNDVMSILRDGNGTFYPVVKDCLESIRDPILLNLPPVRSLGKGIHALPHVGSSQKNQVGVLFVAFEQQLLMPKILKCDLEGVKQALANISNDESRTTVGTSSSKVASEKCDGNRNIFHAAVTMAMPTTNKETETAGSTLLNVSSGGAGVISVNTTVNTPTSSALYAGSSLEGTIDNLASVLGTASGE